jgi:exodeoxyribonuclease V alpha subunit
VIRESLGDRGPCTELPWASSLDVGAAIHAFEAGTNIQLAGQQRRAVEAAMLDKCVVITGGPGVGKTTIVKAIVHLAKLTKKRIALGAPTGRAAKRLGEATLHEAMTIHRLLEYQPHENGFARRPENPLEIDLLVIDETSMVDAQLFKAVMAALPSAAQLVLVGDVDQLPSVGAGSVLSDVIGSGAATVIRLTEIFRQAQASKIVVSAHRINHGELPDLDTPAGANTDFFFIGRDDPEAARQTIIELVSERIPTRFGFNAVTEVQVLAPMHRGELGTAMLNKSLQDKLNPSVTGQLELVRGERTFRRGDKVMQLKNDYDKNVFNGDIGVIAGITTENVVSVEIDGRIATYKREELDQLIHAYAVSIHKSQGSEYPAVVIPLGTQHFMMLQRSLLYTAVTRGKRLVVIVGSRRAVQLAVRNAEARERYTWFAERVRAAVAG